MLAGAAAIVLPRKIRVALIGLDGHTGEVLTPLPQLPDVEVAAIASSDSRALERFAKNPRLTAAKQYSDYRRMLDQEKIDVAGVCNVHSEHAAAALACMERKIHVIAEKPIATENEDLEKLRKIVAQGPAKLTAMLPMRFDSPYLALRQIVEAGELGDVIQIDGQKSYKMGNRPPWFYKRKTYGGTMPWIGIHMVDLMLFTSGRQFQETFGYQNRIGFPETDEMENVSATVFRMDNGGVALLRMDYLRPQTAATHGDDRLRLAGTKGVAEYTGATGVTLMTGSKKPEVISKLPARRSLFVEFLDHIYNGKAAPIPWEQVDRAHRVVLGARQAMESHKVLKLS